MESDLRYDMQRTIQQLDTDWLFHLGEINNGQSINLEDELWCTVNVPHDWSIEGQMLPEREENFSWN